MGELLQRYIISSPVIAARLAACGGPLSPGIEDDISASVSETYRKKIKINKIETLFSKELFVRT